MISYRRANQLQIWGVTLFLVVHIVYAWMFLDVDITRRIIWHALGISILASICLFFIKNQRVSQIAYFSVVLIGAHLMGEELETFAYAIVIYMLLCTVMAIVGERKTHIIYIILVNCAILFYLIIHKAAIARSIPLEYYFMMVLFCEMFLFAQSVMVNIYHQKVSEMEEQNKLLNEAQKSKDEFLANMSHEIRTPMNAIIGMTELISREEDTTEKVKEYCYNIQSSGENLLAIINDILDFSKIESGNMQIYYEPYSIASVVQDVANTVMFRRGFKEIEIIIDCDPKMPKQLIGDVVRNRQILMNLVTNAVKYTEKGYVFISLSCYEKDDDNWLHMEVSDTGIGIREEDQVHLFESFQRVDTTRNRSVEGTGLGLPLCKRLVEVMEGTIEIESEYGKGTTVVVNIPQAVEDASEFLTIRNKQSMKVIVYGDWERFSQKANDYYRIANTNTWSGFGVPYRVILSFSELMKAVENGEITHLYTGVGEYTDQRNYFDHIAKKLKVFVMYDPQYPIKLGEDIIGVQLPFYSVNLAASLNGESFYSQYIDKKEVQITFTAPYARVLVVDDNDVNLRVAEGVLKLYGVTCALARSGKEAIELIKDQDIDVVFMDHMMPEMDGIEAAKIIRRIGGDYGRDLPIIALTANAVNDARDLFVSNGFQDFIAKPISIKRVDSVLRRWLPGSKIEVLEEAGVREIPEFEDGVLSGENEIVERAIFNEAKGVTGTLTADMLDDQWMTINEDIALKNMGGQRDLFKELLEYCLELEEQRKCEINESFNSKDWQEYAIRVHALKGGMRSLGVEELALVAQEQELAAKENRIGDVLEGHAHLLEEYERGHRSIELFLNTFQV